MTLFYLNIGLDIGRVFPKCLIFDEFSFGSPIGCQKVLLHPNLHGKKYCLVLKRTLQETNGLDIGCKFASSLVYVVVGWWSKLRAAHRYPIQS